MPPAFRQRADFTNPASTSSTYSVTLASAVLAGDFLILCIRVGQAFTLVSDNINGSWTQLSVVSNGSNSGAFYYKANSSAAGAGTMVVTVASNNGTSAGVT